MAGKKKAKKELEDLVDLSELEAEDAEIEADEYHERIAEVAAALDGVISAMNISNLIAVNALSALFRHATAQMYSAAYNRPEIHEPLANDIEDDFHSLMDIIAGKANMMAQIADLSDLDKMGLPN